MQRWPSKLGLTASGRDSILVSACYHTEYSAMVSLPQLMLPRRASPPGTDRTHQVMPASGTASSSHSLPPPECKLPAEDSCLHF